MDKIKDFINGKKTYLAAIVAVIGAALAWAHGDETLAQAAQIVLTATLGATIRHGIASSNSQD